MRVPLELSFRDVEKTPAIEKYIRESVSKLEKVCEHLVSCRIAVERPQVHQRKGSPYRVRIDLRVPPGHELVVTRGSSEGSLHDDLRKLLGDAFDAARRQLKSVAERQRGEVKSHPAQENVGIVVRLFADEDYGFLKDVEGREVYFHRNSVLRGAFDRLTEGTGVRFHADEGEEGLQATAVEIVDHAARATGDNDVDQPLGWGE